MCLKYGGLETFYCIKSHKKLKILGDKQKNPCKFDLMFERNELFYFKELRN
jgi:hypothetical protein